MSTNRILPVCALFPKSRRNIELEKAAELIRLLSPDIETVAVTVKPTAEQVKSHQRSGL